LHDRLIFGRQVGVQVIDKAVSVHAILLRRRVVNLAEAGTDQGPALLPPEAAAVYGRANDDAIKS
jgi:hypothetical protein